MAKISNCVTGSTRRRSSNNYYMNLASVDTVGGGRGGGGYKYYELMQPSRVVDSVSCRQLYLRSGYTFSRKESLADKTKNCLGRVRDKVGSLKNSAKSLLVLFPPWSDPRKHRHHGRRQLLVVVKRVEELSCEAFFSIFNKLMSCTGTGSGTGRINHVGEKEDYDIDTSSYIMYYFQHE